MLLVMIDGRTLLLFVSSKSPGGILMKCKDGFEEYKCKINKLRKIQFPNMKRTSSKS